MAIDDATRLADAEVLPDEKQATTVGFLLRAVAWFDTQGITCKRVLSDNGSAYRSKPWREACIALSLRPNALGPTHPEPTERRSGMASGRLRLHPDLVPGMGLRDAVPELRGTRQLAAALPVDL